jgi:hypothetical protein
MADLTVRHNRLSYFSSVGMMLLGVVTFFFVNSDAGLALTVLGLVMYLFYRRQGGRSHAGGSPPAGKRAAP